MDSALTSNLNFTCAVNTYTTPMPPRGWTPNIRLPSFQNLVASVRDREHADVGDHSSQRRDERAQAGLPFTKSAEFTSLPRLTYNSPVDVPASMSIPLHSPLDGYVDSKENLAESTWLQAQQAWDRKFSSRNIQLNRYQERPFQVGERLGGGGVGEVHETSLQGIALALKRTYPRQLMESQLNEIKVLGKVSAERHQHIVKFIGSYAHQKRIGFELGLLIWPVAQTDLSTILHDILMLRYITLPHLVESALLDQAKHWDSENLDHILGCTAQEHPFLKVLLANKLIVKSFGCIASAISFLHSHDIRHKDLKPSQILLSRYGLWLTDFGWSRDMSDSSRSTTSDGYNITLKYQSPERANKMPCGKPEDIFALGCIFFEMFMLKSIGMESEETSMVNGSQSGWVFHQKIDEMKEYLNKQSNHTFPPIPYGFRIMLARMVTVSPKERPTIEEIMSTLSSLNEQLDVQVNLIKFGCNCLDETG